MSIFKEDLTKIPVFKKQPQGTVNQNSIRLVGQSFDGPLGAEVTTFDGVYPLAATFTKTLSAIELEVKLTALIAHARYSGLNVTISNESNPALGMGGYIPRLEIRPDYKAVRAKMDEVSAMKAHLEKHGSHGFSLQDAETARVAIAAFGVSGPNDPLTGREHNPVYMASPLNPIVSDE